MIKINITANSTILANFAYNKEYYNNLCGMFGNWYIACKMYNVYPPATAHFEVHPMTDKFWEFIRDLN
jgi:hypothetical protein